MGAGAGTDGGELVLCGDRVLFGEDKKVLEMDGGNSEASESLQI